VHAHARRGAPREGRGRPLRLRGERVLHLLSQLLLHLLLLLLLM